MALKAYKYLMGFPENAEKKRNDLVPRPCQAAVSFRFSFFLYFRESSSRVPAFLRVAGLQNEEIYFH